MISERQNLVVIGAGIAGLATACFYKRRFLNATYSSWNETEMGAAACSGALGRGVTGRSGGRRMPGFEFRRALLVPRWARGQQEPDP